MSPRFSPSIIAAGLIAAVGALSVAAPPPSDARGPAASAAVAATAFAVRFRTVKIDGLEIFYREAGPKDAPAILLLHGYPTSSHMFRNLIPVLAQRYRVIAPDYPGFGQSSMPARSAFNYTFDNLAGVIDKFTDAVDLTRFAIYVQDYGAPVGFRIASARPGRITGLIVQNGNAYDEGIDNDFWKPIKKYWAEPTEANRAALAGVPTLDVTRWQYTHGVRDVEAISPDAWTIDQAGLDRPGNKDIQLDLFLSYGSNPPLYPKWQQYFRDHQPPTLIVWGKNDTIFPAEGAHPYARDLKTIEINLLDTGHFALEEEGAVIADKIMDFMARKVAPR